MSERLLAGWRTGGALTLEEHLAAYGDLPAADPARLLARIDESGLRGRGGAGFPTAVKMRAVGSGRGPRYVVVNGAEGEPASAKDRLLLESLPHLVLDGAAVAATAVRAREVVVGVSEEMPRALAALATAIDERRDRLEIRVVPVADRYVAGEESALVHALNGGAPIPTAIPPRPFERGVRRRPTLVQNAETLAHLALIARHGAAWFRQIGTDDDPGTTLLTVSGAVSRAGVHEVDPGITLGRLVGDAAPTAQPRAILLGGYFGSWVAPAEAEALPLGHTVLRAAGASLGSGVVVVLPHGACGVCETARVLDWLAGESAGQCGPCTFGLRAIADAFGHVAAGHAPGGTLDRLWAWSDDVEGRGACHHPDGAVRLLRSALRVFAPEIDEHVRAGRCPSGHRTSYLPLPAGARRAAA